MVHFGQNRDTSLVFWGVFFDLTPDAQNTRPHTHKANETNETRRRGQGPKRGKTDKVPGAGFVAKRPQTYAYAALFIGWCLRLAPWVSSVLAILEAGKMRNPGQAKDTDEIQMFKNGPFGSKP